MDFMVANRYIHWALVIGKEYKNIVNKVKGTLIRTNAMKKDKDYVFVLSTTLFVLTG